MLGGLLASQKKKGAGQRKMEEHRIERNSRIKPSSLREFEFFSGFSYVFPLPYELVFPVNNFGI